MPKNDNLSGKIILVTGASKGIGAALSEALVQRNAVVLEISRSTDKLLKLQRLLGKNFIPRPCDVSDQKSIAILSKNLMQEQLIPSVFFLNAGIAGNQATETSGFELEKHRQLMDVNYFGVLAFVQIWKDICMEKDGAHFIVTSSVSAIWAPPRENGYATSKIAITRTFQTLSQIFYKTNLKFTSIHPGPVATKVRRVPFIWSTKKTGTLHDKRHWNKKTTPLSL